MPRLFVCDVHIPPKLAARLRAQGFSAVHTIDLHLETAADRAIWDYAERRGAIVVSKDRDFAELGRRLLGAQVVLVRLGNCTTVRLLDRFFDQLPALLFRLDSGEQVVELR